MDRAGSAAAGRSSTTRASRFASTSRSSPPPTVRVRREPWASARSCSTTRSGAWSRRFIPTTPGRRSSSTPGGRRPGTSTTRSLLADPRTDADVGGTSAGCRRPTTCRPGTPSASAAHSASASTRAAAEPAVHAGHADRRLPGFARPARAHRGPQPVSQQRPGPIEEKSPTRESFSDVEGNQRASGRRAGPHRHALGVRPARPAAALRRAWRPGSAGRDRRRRAIRSTWDSRGNQLRELRRLPAGRPTCLFCAKAPAERLGRTHRVRRGPRRSEIAQPARTGWSGLRRRRT